MIPAASYTISSVIGSVLPELRPLYGHLVRLGGLTGADVALIPVELRYGADGSYLLSVAVVAIRTARVAWYGVVEGAPGDADDQGTLASVAEKMAQVLLPYK